MQHNWVKHVVMSVDVVADPESDEGFIALSDNDRLAQAEEHAVFGCSACSVPLNGETVQTTCSGADAAIDICLG